ncbi:MAG: ABC transporter ATP-binding protein/permease [Coriobacteriales bacterium]|jgi:ATP-binding cassette subfamily B protein|nr:ABC transporter ATP-binding protein/permease [Coriobacteriales bacterium]
MPKKVDMTQSSAGMIQGSAAETQQSSTIETQQNPAATQQNPATTQQRKKPQAKLQQRRRGGGPGRGGPGGHALMPGEKPKNFKLALKNLLRYLGSFKIAILVVLIFALASTVFAIVGPKILGMATTELFEGILGQIAGSGDGPDFTVIAGILLTVLGLYAVSAVFQFIQGFVMANVSNKVSYRLRRDIDAKIMRLPFSYYDKVATGDVMSRITNDVDVINQSLNQSVTQIITSVATLIGVLVMMFSISWLMTLIAILTLPLSLGLIGFIMSKSQKHFTNQQNYLGEVNGLVEENYGAHTVVKAFNGEKAALESFDESNTTLYAAAWKANFLSGLMMPLMNFIGNLGYVIICIVGAYLAMGRVISVGDIQAFIQYMRTFQQPITQVAQISNILQQTMAAAERVFTFLDEPEEVPEKTDGTAVDPETVDGSVSFKHVHFGYTEDKTVINDFSAEIAPGQKIAIVGPTGAGKTTIVKLLMRFYDVESGAVLVGGHDVKDFKRDELRGLFGMVLQDTWLYSASIADNIRYSRLDATDEEVHAAAQVAQADHFITTLPDGYNLLINEEASNISQGQKQLLTIARAVLLDPKILILDEATSSVDTRTELLIQTAMDNLMHGRTSFIIAHRLSTIKNADLILVMDKGDIVEQGSHDELLAADGFYAMLYNSQFDVGEED